MKILQRVGEKTTKFIVSEVDPALLPALKDLYFQPEEDGYARNFPADALNLEQTFVNFSVVLELLLRQTAGLSPIPWQEALNAFLERVEGQDIHWFLGGSAALAVRGIAVTPRDLDIITDAGGARRLGEALRDAIIEPVAPSSGWIADWFGRAFLHARIEWTGEVHASVDEPEPVDFGPVAAGRLEALTWQGRTIYVPPLDLQEAVSARRGLTERVERIRDYIASLPCRAG